MSGTAATAGNWLEGSIEAQVVDSIREIVDPCSVAMGRPLDLVEMGLVEEVHVEARRVDVTLVLTDAACAFYQDMRRQICDLVARIHGVDEVEVHIAPMLWSPDRLLAGPGRLAGSSS